MTLIKSFCCKANINLKLITKPLIYDWFCSLCRKQLGVIGYIRSLRKGKL